MTIPASGFTLRGMTIEERQQSLAAARDAYKWLKDHLVHTPHEPLQGPILCLLKGFEILDAKEQKQIKAGKKYGKLGAAHGKKGGRPRKRMN